MLAASCYCALAVPCTQFWGETVKIQGPCPKETERPWGWGGGGETPKNTVLATVKPEKGPASPVPREDLSVLFMPSGI